MKIGKLKINSYILKFDERGIRLTEIVATKYDEEGAPISWGIRMGGFVMSKEDGEFCHEPMPSSRDEEFFKEFRFDSPQEALDSYQKFHKS